MSWYIVFPARKWESPFGKQGMTWENPIGVFQADSIEEAFLAAAKKANGLGTFFAVEGTPWGLDMEPDPNVKELGKPLDPMDRLEAIGKGIGERLEKALALQAPSPPPQLDQGDGDDG